MGCQGPILFSFSHSVYLFLSPDLLPYITSLSVLGAKHWNNIVSKQCVLYSVPRFETSVTAHP
jgi:hypothetical protein